ncbi:hypothetical protein OROGR_002640 [Orobanche gracilis]
MSQNGKLMPNLDENSTKLLNLTVLQRIDPFVEEILITAAHVALYEFNIDTSQWSRRDVEGSLFVVKRNTQPRFQFIVMNRRNTEHGTCSASITSAEMCQIMNLVENLLGDFEYEVQVPYLLYRNASQEVNGIWFYNARECEEVANLFSRILNAYAKVPMKSKASPTESEFEELDDPVEPLSSSASNAADVPDDRSFVNFFSTAMTIGSYNVAFPGQPYHPSTSVVSAQPHNITLPTLPSAQKPSIVSTSTPIKYILENPESSTVFRRSTELVKPSSLFSPPPSPCPLAMPPITSSAPTVPPLNCPGNLQRPYGTPLLQPFPPPTPPPSLTPASTGTPNYGTVINKEKIREAFQMLVQENQFIDMVYQAMLNAHEP